MAKNYFKRVVSLHPGFSGADLEEAATAARGPHMARGQEVEFQSEWGMSKARYVRNMGAATVEYGRLMLQGRLPCLVTGPGSVNRFNTTATIGHVWDWNSASAIVLGAGNAAPEGQATIVIKHTSAVTSLFNLDRDVSAAISTNDTMVIQSEQNYIEGTTNQGGASQRRTPGVVASYGGIVSGGYGWVITEGVHPHGLFINDVAVATGTGFKVHTTGGWLATGTTNLIGYPLVPVDAAATTRGWPVKMFKGFMQ